MNYLLKHFDTPLIKFSAQSGADKKIDILWINEEKRNLLPLDLFEATSSGLDFWIRHRSIPKNRAYVDNLLSSMGLSINRPFDVIKVSKGLSLNDCYWVVDENDNGTFENSNLYDNRFSRVLGQIAFTGYGSSNISGLTSSPEFTTNGMLPKCWRRESGVVKLYKSGTEGASNTGNEPYSEYYASNIAKQLGINAIDYSISKWKGKLCSVCELFTSKEISFVPVGRIIRNGNIKDVRKYYEQLGDEFIESLNDMIVFDAVIFNTDRHYGNFGFLVDSKSNQIIAPAPLFDHGNSLFSLAGIDALSSEESLLKYSKTLLPCVYDYFVEEAKSVMTSKHKEALRGLLNLRIQRHSRYNLDNRRLTLIEKVIKERIKELL